MRRKVEIRKTEKVEVKKTVELEEYWVLRGIKDTGLKKEVVIEKEIDELPMVDEIAQFLNDNPKATFCSVEHNFRLKGE